MNRVYADLGATIFDVMSSLAHATGAINLGQGFPEDDGPVDIRQVAAKAILEGPNQYPPMRGLPETREAVAAHYNRVHGLDLDWIREVTITSGATEAIAAALLAIVDEGDEVILLEPMYDAYLPLVRRAGGKARFVRLHPPLWRVDEAALRQAITPKTRAIIVNTPINPAAHVLGEGDLAVIAKVCVEHDLIAISDEVWEHVTFDGVGFSSLLAAPGMRERTIKIGSAGKMFQLTGWKVGFVCAAPALNDAVVRAHQFLTFTTPPNLQRAAAYGLAKDESYFAALRADLQCARDHFCDALSKEGLVTTPASGTYFINLDLRASGFAQDDDDFALTAVKDAGVATIPLSAFYAADPPKGFVRLCFAKRKSTLEEGARRLGNMRRLVS